MGKMGACASCCVYLGARLVGPRDEQHAARLVAGAPLGERISLRELKMRARREAIAQNAGLPQGVATALGDANFRPGPSAAVWEAWMMIGGVWYSERLIFMRDGSVYLHYERRWVGVVEIAQEA